MATLIKKLGIKDHFTLKLIHPPANYFDLLEGFSESWDFVEVDDNSTPIDFIHFFTNNLAEYKSTLPILKNQIKKTGMIWISWYKKAAKMPTELDGNIIRTYALQIGLVDSKVCAINHKWSGLKVGWRIKDR